MIKRQQKNQAMQSGTRHFASKYTQSYCSNNETIILPECSKTEEGLYLNMHFDQHFEPEHNKTNKMTCVTSKDSESSLYAQWVAKDPRLLHAETKGSDQTERRLWSDRVDAQAIRVGGCPSWSESWLGAQAILLVLSCCSSTDSLLATCHAPQTVVC